MKLQANVVSKSGHGNTSGSKFLGVALLVVHPPATGDTDATGTYSSVSVEAVTRTKEYSKMNKAEMNSAYDDLRKSDPAKAAIEGKKMHRAFFNK